MTTIISYFQRLSFRFINFLFGKSTIFIVIFGWYLVITGLLFLVRPKNARSKIFSTGFGIVKFNLLIVAFFIWGILVKWSQKFSGTAQTSAFWIGLVGLIILFLWVRSFAKKKLSALVERISPKVLIVFAWAQVVIGAFMVYLQRRLW